MKLYNHSLAPNPRRVRIFAAEKSINLTLEEVDILVGQSRTPEFLEKNSSGAVPVLELDLRPIGYFGSPDLPDRQISFEYLWTLSKSAYSNSWPPVTSMLVRQAFARPSV